MQIQLRHNMFVCCQIYNKLTQVMPFEKIKCLHSDLYNHPHTNAYKCSENNITQKKKKVTVQRG